MVKIESEIEIKSLRVQIKSANLQDVGKNFARISEEYLNELGIKPGDLVEIAGKNNQRTTVVVWAAAKEDPEDIIRINGTIRGNTGTALDEFVFI